MKSQKGTFPFNMNLFDGRWKNSPGGMARYTMLRRDSDFKFPCASVVTMGSSRVACGANLNLTSYRLLRGDALAKGS
jgi:hypothetical protein